MRKTILLLVLLLATFTVPIVFESCTGIPPDVTQPTDVTQVPQSPSNQNGEDTRIVDVDFYILNIGKLDMATGEFIADFYLYFSSDRSNERGKVSNFEFCNGNANRKDDYFPDMQTYDFYRIEAVLRNNLDLSRYPFDRHEITIALEDKYEFEETMIYKVAKIYPPRDPSLKIPGWEIEGDDRKVVSYEYPWGKVSRFIYAMDIRRPVVTGFLKTILPALIMVMVGLLSL
jgi:hypothetical protein